MSTSDNIQVFIRVRPLNTREAAEDPKSCLCLYPKKLIVDTKEDKAELKTYNFDWIAPESSTQQEIFEVIGKPMADTCLQGYNCCIFAYGQTGAGKTYTMQGRGLESGDEVHCGLEPRILDYIFALKTQDEAEHPDVQYSITCGYVEIYNEQIIDLFNPSQRSLNVREDLIQGVFIDNLTEIEVSNYQETLKYLQFGARNRHVGSTNMNLESSRSHSLFIMTIQRATPTATFTSKFNFVDLAGSERQKNTNSTGVLLKEAGNINKSLSVLGKVINSLVETSEGKVRHIPYRNSKLTFILRDSLGGNSKTCLIANVSPASSSLSETISTLRFAQRAKMIKTKACINEDIGGDIEDLKRELERVKNELMYYKQQLEIENELRVAKKEGEAGSLETSRQDSTRLNSQCLEQSKRVSSDFEIETEKELPFYSSLNDIQMLSSVNQGQPQCEQTSVQEEIAKLKRENQLLLEALNSATAEMEANDETKINILPERGVQMEIEDVTESSESKQSEENEFLEDENNSIPEIREEKFLQEEGLMGDIINALLEMERLRKERTRQDDILAEKMDKLAQAENLTTQQKDKLLETEVLRQELQEEEELSEETDEVDQEAQQPSTEEEIIYQLLFGEGSGRRKVIVMTNGENPEKRANWSEETENIMNQLLGVDKAIDEGARLEYRLGSIGNDDFRVEIKNPYLLNDIRRSWQENREAFEADLRSLINTAREKEKRNFREMVKEVKDSFAMKNEENERLKKLLEEKEKELCEASRTTQRLVVSLERNQGLQEELEGLANEINAEKMRASQEEERLKRIIEEQAEKIQELASFQEKNETLEEELQRLTNENNDKENRLKCLAEENEQNFWEAHKITQELVSLQRKNKTLEEELQKLTEERNAEKLRASQEEERLKGIIQEQTEKNEKRIQEINKASKEDLQRSIDEGRLVASQEHERLKGIIEEKEKKLLEAEKTTQELASLQAIIQALKQDLERLAAEKNEDRVATSQEEERLKGIIEEQAKKSLKDESRIQELENNLKVEREERLTFEKILKDDIQDCSQSRAYIMTKEDNLNKLQEQLLLKEQSNPDSRRIFEEAQKKQELSEEIIRSYQDSLAKEERASAKLKEELEEAEKLNQELLKQIEALHEGPSNKFTQALHNEGNDDKENDIQRKKELPEKVLLRTQSDCREVVGKRSYEKVRNMNIERGVFSEQKLSKREAKDWDLAGDDEDYDDLKLVKKVKPTVQ